MNIIYLKTVSEHIGNADVKELNFKDRLQHTEFLLKFHLLAVSFDFSDLKRRGRGADS